MQRILLFITIVLLSCSTMYSQQILTLEGGSNHLIYHRQNLDDEYLEMNITKPSGFEVGLDLKLFSKHDVDGKILINFTHSTFDLQSAYDTDYDYGDADVSIALNALRFGYLVDYSVGRNVKFFMNGGPTFTWMFDTRMTGIMNTYDVNGSEVTHYETKFDGKQENMHSKGIFGLVAKTGFEFPVNRKMSIQVSGQLIYDFNWHCRDNLKIVTNQALNTMLYANAMVGISYDIGVLLTDEEWSDW